jgi:hypothetical protein
VILTTANRLVLLTSSQFGENVNFSNLILLLVYILYSAQMTGCDVDRIQVILNIASDWANIRKFRDPLPHGNPPWELNVTLSRREFQPNYEFSINLDGNAAPVGALAKMSNGFYKTLIPHFIKN